MYIYMYTSIVYMYIYISLSLSLHIYIHVYIYIDIFIYTCVYIYVCVYVYVYVFVLYIFFIELSFVSFILTSVRAISVVITGACGGRADLSRSRIRLHLVLPAIAIFAGPLLPDRVSCRFPEALDPLGFGVGTVCST